MVKVLLPALSAFAMTFSCSHSEVQEARTTYRTNPFTGDTLGEAVIEPEVAYLRHTVYHVFSVPRRNCVATNDIRNGITLFRFEARRLSQHLIMHNFLRYVGGGKLSFGPVMPDGTLYYTQSRQMIRIDVDARTAKKFAPLDGEEPMIERFEVLDASEHVLVLEYNYLNAVTGNRDLLTVVDLDRTESRNICRIDVGRSPRSRWEWTPWTTDRGKILSWNDSTRRIRVWNSQGQEDRHDFADAVNATCAQDLRSVRKILVHDHLSVGFALDVPTYFSPYRELADTSTSGEPESIRVIDWLAGAPNDRALFSDGKGLPGLESYGVRGSSDISDFQLSPGGQWLLIEATVNDRNLRDYTYFFVAPIGFVFQELVGKPIMLLCPAPYNMWSYGNAWISDPLSFVVAGGDRLYKWELEGLHERLVEEYRTAEAERSERSSSSVR